MVEGLLGQAALPVDAEQHLQVARAAGGAALDEAGEPLGLAGEAERLQGAQGQRGVAEPAEPVVPVAAAADPLGQRGRRGGRDRAGAGVGERLEHDRRAQQPLAVWAGHQFGAGLRAPAPPPGNRGHQPPVAFGGPVAVDRGRYGRG